MVLVGKTGVGKSATANLLCNEQNFFLSRAGSSSVTETCKHKKVKLDNKNVLVVDTPGLCDSQRPKKEIEDEIKKCVKLCAPSIQAILYVISLSSRLTPEDFETFESLTAVFDQNIYNYTIVIFTNPESLSDEGQTLEDYIKSSPELDAFVKKCSNRKLAINNKASKLFADQQRRTIITNIELLINKNNGKGYTNREFTEAGQKIIETTLKRFKNEYQEKLDKAKEKYRKEIRKTLEAEYEQKNKVETKRFNDEKKELEKQIKELKEKLMEQSLDETRIEIANTMESKVW